MADYRNSQTPQLHEIIPYNKSFSIYIKLFLFLWRMLMNTHTISQSWLKGIPEVREAAHGRFVLEGVSVSLGCVTNTTVF